jgi:hypothetical protein
MARTGQVLGSIEVVVTALLVVAGLLAWNTYGDDIQRGLQQVDEFSQEGISVPDLVLGGLTGEYSVDDLRELGGMLGDADELQDLGGQCRSGDAGACQDLLDRVPDSLRP